jgi:hypothetical protein
VVHPLVTEQGGRSALRLDLDIGAHLLVTTRDGEWAVGDDEGKMDRQ